nr:hypothetical protein [Tanacetum cinerariifolium]
LLDLNWSSISDSGIGMICNFATAQLPLLELMDSYVNQTLNPHSAKQTSLYLNCSNLSELNLNSCKALLVILVVLINKFKLRNLYALSQIFFPI